MIGGRYGLGSKEFAPAHVKAVFDELVRREGPRNHFTVGIVDDVSHTSIRVDPEFDIDSDDRVRAVFFGLGADGTVGANKNSIKIIGEETDNDAQGYFVYDSKKSGAITISHLRFGPGPIRSSYLIRKANFVACHQWGFLERYDMLEYAVPGGTFLLNSPYPKAELWKHLPRKVQEQVLDKKLKLYGIDADKVAEATGMGNRINSVMQTSFFAISGVLPREQAIEKIKKAIEKTYGKKGDEIVKRNYASVDATLENLFEVDARRRSPATATCAPTVPAAAPDFVKRVQAVMIEGKGDLLPVSAFPVDGTWPTGTAQWEKRAIALEIPVWDEGICIQCNKCAFVCPHAAIRAKVYDPEALSSAPATFKSMDFKGNEYKGQKYTIQVAPEDCTGCSLCVMVCPAKDKSNPKHKAIDMAAMPPLREAERENYAFFLDLPEPKREEVKLDLKGSQFLTPLFEYSGACAGCGETPVRQADDAALRRPRAGRERHRLLVDLRRQPPDDALHGRPQRARPGLVELALRGQRRVRARDAAGARPAQRAGRGPAERPRLAARRQPGPGDPRGRPVERGGHLGAAQARGGAQGGARRRSRAPRRSACCSSPTTWSRRTSGSSAATAGPTTSATAASTTCCRCTATSTCWCSTPRSTRTPAASSRRPPRSAPRPSSPRRARSRRRRTSA